MKARELRGKSSEELRKELLELTREAFNLRMQRATGQQPRPSQYQVVRRGIARVKTVLRERGEARS